jgi:hypothetical protein
MTKISMRPAAQEDEQFLSSVYCVNMRHVVEQAWGWDDAWQLAEFRVTQVEPPFVRMRHDTRSAD